MNRKERDQYIQDQLREHLEKAIQENRQVADLLDGITGRPVEGDRNRNALESDLRLAKSYQELLGFRIALLIGALDPGPNVNTPRPELLPVEPA